MNPQCVFVVLIAGIGILVLYAMGARLPMLTTQQDNMPDYWETPFYLRHNTAVPTSREPILVQAQPVDSWSIASGVPPGSQAYGGWG